MNLTDPALAAGSFGSYICKVKKLLVSINYRLTVEMFYVLWYNISTKM